jgi:hypothetical protein
MPILEIEIITHPGEQLRDTLAKELADAAGSILGSEAGGTWVRLRDTPIERYAEGPGAGPQVFPVFVNVLKARLPDAAAMQLEVDGLTEVFAGLCDRPKLNVLIRYEPEGHGRVAFGGRLLTD